MNNPDKLFLIDGMALIYRSYYAMIKNPLISSSGINTSAIYGFINSLLKIIKDEQPEYISIILDTKKKTFRHKMYTDYKATRKPMPDDLSEQLIFLYDILESLGIAIYKKDGFEADDLIGTISNNFKNENLITYIYSSDKDLMQLVNKQVFVYSPGNNFVKAKIYNENEVFLKWGVMPNQIIDYLSLVGDTSDNIPGVKGVGAKTATKLLDKYNNLTTIYDSIDLIENERMKNKLIDFEQDAILSKKLVTIDLDVDIEYNLNEMKIENLNFLDINDKLNELDIFTFDKIINTKKIDKENKDIVDKEYHIVDSIEKIDKLIKKIDKYEYISIDLETTDVNPNIAKIVGISLSFKANEAYYIPFQYPENKKEDISNEILNRFKGILESDNKKFIGQNIKYDSLVLKRAGINLSKIYFDTMIAESLISPEKNSYKLEILSENYLNYRMMSIEKLIGEKKPQKTMDQVPLKDIAFYACEDADITFQIYQKQNNKLKKLNLKKVFYEIEIPLIDVLVELEYNGVYVDMNIINDLSNQLKNKICKISKNIFEIAGKEFNLNSPKQLAEILFDDLQLKQFKKRSTSFEVLNKLRDYHPIVDYILEYRHLSKLINTYLNALPTYLNDSTGRIHTSYNQVIVSTGRLSSNKPNFQNIPIKSKEGKNIRKAFTIFNENSYIISFDYSQIELRILAHYSNEKKLIKSFQNNEDVHSRTAALIYGLDVSDVTEEHRRVAKTINYSIIYGAGAFRISQELRIPIKQATNIIENYFNRYPGIQKYIQETTNNAFRNGYVETLHGRQRKTINLNSSNRNIVEAEKRASINMPIQGTASELIKIAMVKILKKMKNNNMNSKMILQVHDELLFEVCKNELEDVILLVKNEMEKAVYFKVPIKVDYNYGKNWFEAH